MADKDPFDDDLMAPPAEDEVVELEDSGLGVEELTEADETQSSTASDATDFGDIDLDAPVEDLPTFEPTPPASPSAAADPAGDTLFESTDLSESEAPAEQQSFGFEEPQPSAADLKAVGEDSLSQSPVAPKQGKGRAVVFIAAGVIGVALIGGLALFMLSGSEAPAPMAPAAYAPDPAPVEVVPAPASETAVAEAAPIAEAPAAAEVAAVPVAAAPKPAPKPEVKAEPKVEPKPTPKPKAAAAPSSGRAATRLQAVDVSTVGGADIVRFEFDGDAPTKIGSFALSDTPRYVVDFYGVETAARLGAASGRVVTAVRPGKHEGKYRVVIDLTTDGVTAKRRVEGNAVIIELR